MSSQAIRPDRYDVVVLGAGYAGLMAAPGSANKAEAARCSVNAEEPFVERVRLQESIAAPVKPRIPSLTAWLARTPVDYICGIRYRLILSARPCVSGSIRAKSVLTKPFMLGSRVDVATVSGGADHAYRLDPGEDRARGGAADNCGTMRGARSGSLWSAAAHSRRGGGRDQIDLARHAGQPD